MNQQVVRFQEPRLPYHPALEERFQIDRGQWKVLVEATFPSAETVDAVVMALSYCKARNLDVFKKPVHIVPVYDSKRRQMVETVWPGIAEIRTTAMRTQQYAGCDAIEWGPEITRDLDGVSMTFPEWGRLTVYRLLAGVRCPFVGPQVYWLESYATAKRDTAMPNTMWRKRPSGQLEKCVEAAALRKAFPEELGGVYAAEEMEGRVIGADGSPLPTTQVVTPRGHGPKLHAGFDDPEPVQDAEFSEPEPETAPQTPEPVIEPETPAKAQKVASKLETGPAVDLAAETDADGDGPAEDWSQWDHAAWVEGQKQAADAFKTMKDGTQTLLKDWWTVVEADEAYARLMKLDESAALGLKAHVVRIWRTLPQ